LLKRFPHVVGLWDNLVMPSGMQGIGERLHTREEWVKNMAVLSKDIAICHSPQLLLSYPLDR